MQLMDLVGAVDVVNASDVDAVDGKRWDLECAMRWRGYFSHQITEQKGKETRQVRGEGGGRTYHFEVGDGAVILVLLHVDDGHVVVHARLQLPQSLLFLWWQSIQPIRKVHCLVVVLVWYGYVLCNEK